MKLKDLKKGEYFTLKPISDPKESQVYIRGEYDRNEKKYDCGKFDDISYSRFLKGDKEVYTDFTFQQSGMDWKIHVNADSQKVTIP